MEWWERLEQARQRAGLSRAELARRSGLTREAVQKYARGGVDNPRGNTLKKLAHELGVSEIWLRVGEEPNASIPPDTTQVPVFQSLPKDIPVLGSGMGGPEGAINFDGEIDRIRRPPALADAKDVYAVFVNGDSMEPRYFNGEPVFVSSRRGVGVGDHVVIQCRTDAGDLIAFIKVITGRRGPNWRFGQYNPQSEWTPGCPVETVHRIFPPLELYIF